MITVLNERTHSYRLYKWMNSNGEELIVDYNSGEIEISSNSLNFDEFSKFGTINDFYGSLIIPSYKDKDVVEVINVCLDQLGLNVRITLDELRSEIRNTYY